MAITGTRASRAIYRRRRVADVWFRGLSLAATGFGLTSLVIILVMLIYMGASGLNTAIFTEITPPPGEEGGLINAIVGSLIMTSIGIAFAIPIGIFAGTYLAEYGRYSSLSIVIRFINDILLSAPSIVVGLFVYEIMVVTMGRFSGIAGAVALAIIALPVIVRTTEDMMRLVPDGLREAATALGAPRWHMIRKVAYRAAGAGIVTGILLSIARISGETAPLLFTALNNQFWSTNLLAPMSSLPAAIFSMALSPYKDWQQLAWTGALLITFAVLSLNIIARLFRTK